MNVCWHHVTQMPNVPIQQVHSPVPVILGIVEMVSHVLVSKIYPLKLFTNYLHEVTGRLKFSLTGNSIAEERGLFVNKRKAEMLLEMSQIR